MQFITARGECPVLMVSVVSSVFNQNTLSSLVLQTEISVWKHKTIFIFKELLDIQE